MPAMVESEPYVNTTERVDAFLKRKRTLIVGAMCCFAFLRILGFAAAFPLFNNVDEQDHYEMVQRFAHGYVPQKELPLTDPELARAFALYGSPEYLVSQQRLHQAGMDVPVPQLPPQIRDAQFQKRFDYWVSQRVTEAQSPPVYYALAGVWYKAGAALGIKDWTLAYWVRFLNPVLYVVFLWIAFLFVREVYPENIFLSVAVPGFLAVFPQDVFFGVNRDILSPLLMALALLLLFRAIGGRDGWRENLIAGGAITGLAFLTDVPNIILFGVLAAAIWAVAKRNGESADGGRNFTPLLATAVAALLPPVLWMARNRAVMGDLTGSKAKILYLGWTLKPLGEIWRHPIFTLRGAGYFLREVILKYWRGELVWQGIPMRSVAADGFYLGSTLLLVTAFAFWLSRREARERISRLSDWSALYLVTASVLFLAAISLPFDFHDCVYPSRQNPYFLSGRIICGSLLPFAVVYARGLQYLWRPVRKYVHPIFPVMGICVFILCVEIAVRATVFHSRFNFFTLR